MNEAYNIDCMEFMRRVPSKYFDTRNTRVRTTRFLIHTLGAGQAELPLTIWRLISSGVRSTQNIFRSKNSVLKNIQRSSGYSYDRRKEGTSW